MHSKLSQFGYVDFAEASENSGALCCISNTWVPLYWQEAPRYGALQQIGSPSLKADAPGLQVQKQRPTMCGQRCINRAYFGPSGAAVDLTDAELG